MQQGCLDKMVWDPFELRHCPKKKRQAEQWTQPLRWTKLQHFVVIELRPSYRPQRTDAKGNMKN